jgi:LacI family transcriptional regulator
MNRGEPGAAHRPTIEDVSRVAGVSIKTVSRVLNREKYVAPATKAKVDAAVAELGFRPSFAARALAGGRSFQIALIHDNPSPYFAQNIQAGVRTRCADSGYRMIAQPCDADAPGLIDDILSLIDQAQLDGVILTPPFTEMADVRAAIAGRGLRFVETSPVLKDDAVPSVSIDHEQAAYDMTAHLIAQGHQRIAFIDGDPRYAAANRRCNGYIRAMADAGFTVDPAMIVPGRYDFASGSQAAETLLDLPEPPTAIFASSDDMAAGVLATAHRRDIRVPDHLSVAGFDDTDLASVVWPPLTTIRQPVREIGWAAADLLLSSGDEVEHRTLAHALIVRDTVGGVVKSS